MTDSLFHRSDTLILFDSSEVDAYLRSEVGLGVEVLLEALQRGGSEAAMATPHNAAAAAGFRFWDGAVASLRDQLVPRGWFGDRPGGLEVVRRRDNRLQITASLGDEAVGGLGTNPSCRHEKGQSTDAAMQCNQLTLAGYGSDDPGWEPMLTWWLLYKFTSPDARRIVPELSLPRVGVGGRVTDWAVRLLLPTINFGDRGPIRLSDLPNPAATIEVPVRRAVA